MRISLTYIRICTRVCHQSGENHRLQMELSMHRAEKEALNEDRQKLQRQMMALTADKETLQDQLKQVSS